MHSNQLTFKFKVKLKRSSQLNDKQWPQLQYRGKLPRVLTLTALLVALSFQFCQAIAQTTPVNGATSGSSASFIDLSTLKPSLLLITPQSFRVSTHQNENDDSDYHHLDGDSRLKQNVIVINNIHSNKDDQLVRQHFKKLSLQVRDARSPITGQLFYEHVFDYFPSSQQSYQIIPVNLDLVSPISEHVIPTTRELPNGANDSEASTIGPQQATFIRPQQLIVSIRPYQYDSGFGSDHLEFVSSAPIPVESVPSNDVRRNFGTIQTDKPIYKPSEKVRIRSVIINEALRPVSYDELTVQIKNPHKIIVEEIKFPYLARKELVSKRENTTNSREKFFIDHVFEFPPEPMLGTWSVHLLLSDAVANDTTSFEVREYVLPTFEIEFESPKYILPNTQNITGALIAKYHYGRPVQGKAQFKFGYKETPTSKPRFIARSSIKTIDISTGRVEYRINSDKFKENEWFPSIAGSRFIVEATVTEMTTGHREVAQDTSSTFITMPYRISFEESIEYFKPGLSQPLTVQLFEVQTQNPPPSGTKIFAQYKDQNGSILNAASIAANNQPVDFRQVLDTESQTNADGRATFFIGPLKDDVTSIHVTLKWVNITKNDSKFDIFSASSHNNSFIQDLATGYHTLQKHESHGGWISLMNKSLTHMNVGEQFVSDLLIRDAMVTPQRIYYMLIAGGQIFDLRTLNSDGLVKFTLTEAMVPSIRLLLFAITQDSVGLISDSMRINVGQALDCGLKLRYESSNTNIDTQLAVGSLKTYPPDDKGKLTIQGRQGDIISLIGVDSAVYSMNNRSKLDSSRIVQRIKKLDPGCGFGGGRNNLDVFHNAGLMIFRDVHDPKPNDAAMLIGSSCLTVVNQLKHLEDIQMGFSRPMFSAALQLNRPRSLELLAGGLNRRRTIRSNRTKREVDVESILKRYKDSSHRACCRLGTMEDYPQNRNCSLRSRIVEKYMRQSGFRACHRIYFDCCRAIYGESLLLGSMLSARDQSEQPVIESRVVASHQAPQFSEPVPNIGHLDKIESQTLVRKDFRETWLFDLVSVAESDGSAKLEVKLPHSLTTWTVSALSVNRFHPICVMPRPLTITTFKDIFIQVSMPYKVIQGEQLDLLVTVFNYSPQNQEIFVYMYGIENVCSEAEPGERSERKRVRLGKHGSQSVLFPIIPLKIGKYNLKVLAVTLASNGSDIVERELNVVPRGKSVIDETTFSLDPLNQQRRSKRAIQTGNLVDEIDSSRGLQRSRVRLTPSRDSEFIVPQTQECIVSAIGDRMGQSVHTSIMDVENLIRLPHGCGEQVMIYMGPTLYTATYLSSIEKLNGDLRWRAVRYIRSGYQRILNFRQENGAFSAFPRREPSVWLTAFIVKMLCQTERAAFVTSEVRVDRSVVNTALEWLIMNQNNDTGVWLEANPVYHREMLGGVGKENMLTAFVAISLNECAHHADDLMKEKGETMITAEGEALNLGNTGTDRLRVAQSKAEQALLRDRSKQPYARPYVLALTAYALSFSRPLDAVAVLNDLIFLADRSQARNQVFWRGDYAVETAAYALQALIELTPFMQSRDLALGSPPVAKYSWNPASEAVAVANWLSSRRSFTGAFESTQDTVVALEALSKLAQLSNLGVQSLSTNASNSSNPHSILTCNLTMSNRIKRSIEFGKDNSQVLQSFKLDSFDVDTVNGESSLDVLTSGNGLGIMSVKLKYNVFQEEDEFCRFNIDSSIEEWQPKISSSKGPQSADDSSTSNINQHGSNQTQNNDAIDEEYFKNFDKLMLGELNLITNFEANSSDRSSPPIAPQLDGNQASRDSILRFKRSTEPRATASMPDDSWTSRIVSTFKSKLPAWLSPVKPTAAPATSLKHSEPRSSESSGSRRNNTSRRSTPPTQVPLVASGGSSTGLPVGAKVNALSKQLEILQQQNDSRASGGVKQSQQVNGIGGDSNSFANIGNRLVLLLQTCVHHMSSRRDSEMAVIEIGILSGFKPNEADLKEIVNDIGTPAMKYELSADRTMVIIYLQYVPFSGPYCLQFRLIRESFVYNLQSGYIRVYEYYSPAHSCSNIYTPSRQMDLLETKCDSSGQVCQCASKSLCPASNKLLDLAQVHSVNATSARAQLIDLVCSNRFDLVSLVRLKNVRYVESGKIFKLLVKVKSDLRGNLSQVINLQRQQRRQLASSVRKPKLALTAGVLQPEVGQPKLGEPLNAELKSEEEDESNSLDQLTLSLDSSCARNDPLLVHLAHPNQRKNGGELMILFANSNKLEKRFFKVTPKASTGHQVRRQIGSPGATSAAATSNPKVVAPTGSDSNNSLVFEDSQSLMYSTGITLDRDTIFHDVVYQAKIGQREAINNLILWLELRARHENWSCESRI